MPESPALLPVITRRHLSALSVAALSTALTAGLVLPEADAAPTGTSRYYVPDNGHSTVFAGAGSTLRYSTRGSAVVNGTRVLYL